MHDLNRVTIGDILIFLLKLIVALGLLALLAGSCYLLYLVLTGN